MKGIGIALCLVAFGAHGGVNVLSDLPWFGDGLPDRNGADWYEEDPAPGNGFYNLPPLHFWGHRLFREVVAHRRPCFKMAIDGVERPLEWKWRKTNVIRNSVYLGTEIDATRPARSMSSRRRPARSSAATVGRARRMSPASATRMSAAARRASASSSGSAIRRSRWRTTSPRDA